jgi:hypothetical protein
MSNLSHRQQKIQEKRKQTPRREFVMEICSWMPLWLSKNGWKVSRYPEERMKHLVSNTVFNEQRDALLLTQDFYSSNVWFLQSLSALWYEIPFSATIQQWLNENSDYADSVLNSKNVYLSFWVFESCADVYYSVLVTNNCRSVFNSIQITNYSENIYYSIAVDKSSFIFYSKYILNSHNLYFCSNMIGCHDCMLCDGLENQSYCIKNKQLTKEEYAQHKAKIFAQQHVFHQFPDPRIISKNYNSANIDGNCILFSNDIQHWLYVTRANTWRNLVFVTWEDKDAHIYDCCDCGINGVDFYAVQGGGTNASQYYCIGQSESCNNIYYSYYLYNCSFCLGCIGLKNKSYCILNKQYTKEERYEKADEIFAQMDADGTLGQFFPASMNPFYFNDTAAYLIDNSFTKEEVTAKWYLRRDEPIKVDIPEGMEVVKTSELGGYEWFDTEWNRSINADILKKVIQDEQWNVYRIIPMEYKFLVKHGLPLPRKHRLERMKENFRIS